MKQQTIIFYTLFSYFILCCPLSSTKANEATPIIFGQTAALTGPVSALGHEAKSGIMAAFSEFNANGGLNGRPLELISYDDGYEPDNAIANTHKLIDDDHVFALIGAVGTPTSNAIVPIITENKVPFIAPFTGAELLRNPFNPMIVNLRSSYWQETEEWVKYLVDTKGYKDIAIMYQDDSYGRTGLQGVQQALKKRDLSLVAEGTYTRNTTAVKSAFLRIRKAKPEAVVFVGTYKAVASFIKLAQKFKMDSDFMNISFVGAEALANELGPVGQNVLVTQVVPSPYSPDETLPIIASYQSAMDKYAPDMAYSYVSMDGYLAGRFTIEVLKKIEGPITRQAFINTIYKTGDFMLDALPFHFSDQNNQGSNNVYITKITKDGTIAPVK